MTGWGAGYCAGYGRPGLANTMPGRGWSGFSPGFSPGLGRGRGRGMGRRWFSPYRYYPRW
jgi:hypothetical protein